MTIPAVGLKPQAASPGRHPGNLLPSLREAMREPYSLSRVANYPLKPADMCRKQIRIYYE